MESSRGRAYIKWFSSGPLVSVAACVCGGAVWAVCDIFDRFRLQQLLSCSV